MKYFLQTCRDIFLILLCNIIGLMAGGIWLDSWEVNKFVLPLHFFAGPIIQLVVFLFGFHFLKRKIFYDKFETVVFPPCFLKKYFYYAFGLLILCAMGTLLIGGKFVFPQMDNYLFAQNIASLIGTVLISPFIEEIIFRVVIISQISKRYSVKAGVIVSSLLFGVVHLMNGQLSVLSAIQLIIAGTLIGIFLSLVYVKENSVWASFTIHSLYNGVGSIIPVDTQVTSDWPIEFVLKTDNAFVTGGQYGIDCSLVNIIAYIIMIFILMKLIQKQKVNKQKEI